MSFFGALRLQWRNGGKGLIALGFVALLLIVVNAALLFSQIVGDPEFSPMEGDAYEGAQPTQDETVVDGTLYVGPVTKCNTSGYAVLVVATQSWRRVEPSVRFVPGPSLTAVREPGCKTTEYENVVPPDVTPGTWQLFGSEVIVGPNNELQRIGWRTEPFEVVAQ